MPVEIKTRNKARQTVYPSARYPRRHLSFYFVVSFTFLVPKVRKQVCHTGYSKPLSYSEHRLSKAPAQGLELELKAKERRHGD